MSRAAENTAFTCERCGRAVAPLSDGSYRNHCPFCLYSKHVDIEPGDRQSDCGGLMEPVGAYYHTKKGYQIRHRCLVCGAEQSNKAALETIQPDDFELLIRLVSTT